MFYILYHNKQHRSPFQVVGELQMAFADITPCIDCLLSLILFQENILPCTPPSPTERLQFQPL